VATISGQCPMERMMHEMPLTPRAGS
jgi:hypothetical protein